jgi:hypothetical protein
MATAQLAITNVVNVSVANPPAGLSNYKLNNLALFTKETPIVSIPVGTYAVYMNPQAVGVDWGTGSEAYNQAVGIFSQSPNILDGGGSLIIVPMAGGDTLSTTLTAISGAIFFGGVIWGGYAPIDAEVTAAAADFQAAQKLLFAPSHLTASIAGVFTTIKSATQTYTRCLLYTVSAVQARLFAAIYASRAMSTDFDGSNTTSTMHLKDLVGIVPDPGITQTFLTSCATAGVDVFCNIGPLPKVFTSGGNTYFDQVYGQLWLIFAMQVAGFNALAQSPTKVPQTEAGMASLRNAYTAVCQLAVTNGFSAPGAWNSPQTFGNAVDLIKNVLQRGFYVYSIPVNQQSQSSRVARQAPLVQIALKLAGAIHSTNVVVYINP